MGQQELNATGQTPFGQMLQEAEAQRATEKQLGAAAQLSGVEEMMVRDAAKKGIDVNTGQPLQPGQTPPPLEGTHPATHAEQLGIAQPYQTEREELVQLADAGKAIERAYDATEVNPRLDGKFLYPGKDAMGVWALIDQIIIQDPDPSKPIHLTPDDFSIILDDEVARTDALQVDKANLPQYLLTIRGGLGDSWFFRPDYRERRYIIPGLPDSGGKGILGADLNYFKIGMITAAAGRSLDMLKDLVVVHNQVNIWSGHNKAHNQQQMTTGKKWAEFGYNEYLKRKGRLQNP